MGCIIDEKSYEHEDEEMRWLFRLVLYSDPTDDPSVTVRKQDLTNDGWKLDQSEGVYRRAFDRGTFNEHHYANFRSKFVRDPEYREQYYDPSPNIHPRPEGGE